MTRRIDSNPEFRFGNRGIAVLGITLTPKTLVIPMPLTHSRTAAAILFLSALSFATLPAETPGNFQPENLVPWCIVPFDAKKRSPAERAEMLVELGLKRCAYDWRNHHVAEFEEEILEYKKHGIEFFAFWGGHESAYALFEKYNLHPQIWRTLGSPTEGAQSEKVAAAADSMEELAKRTAQLGCKLGLYNHGGWGGEPANLVAVCEELRNRGHKHVGIVYNWHHGHGHITDWAESLALMTPYLHCLNLNGMNPGAEPKILPLSQGKHELEMLRVVLESGYNGPIGILDHQNTTDSFETLSENLKGLDWLLGELEKPGSSGDRPKFGKATTSPKLETSLAPAFGQALSDGLLVPGNADWREPPITVECRAKLKPDGGYHILLASDTKASAAHWEIFAMKGDGTLTAYLPGATPDHVRSDFVIADGKWHSVSMKYAPDRVRLRADGKVVADQEIELKPSRKVVPGGLGIGRLVEGRIGMRGAIDEVRIRAGIVSGLDAVSPDPFPESAEGQLGHWDFEDPAVFQSAESTKPVAKGAISRAPLEPELNPYWEAEINRDRVYDFYAKQALHFGNLEPAEVPEILPAFPGLDGGKYGHWGNQNDKDTWKDGRVREMDHGSMVSGVFRGAGLTLPRAVSVRLGDGINAVFDQKTLTFAAAWKGELVEWSDVRRGIMRGIPMGGKETVPLKRAPKPADDARYLGFHRTGQRVVFAYLENGETRYRSAEVRDGAVIETVSSGAPGMGDAEWPERLEARGERGKGQPYAIDTLTLPYANPWNALFFVSGIDFLAENRIAICTIHGDVWICDVSSDDLAKLTWKRFAAGLHQPLGLKVADGVIHVMCRDQLIALHDRNGDDEADFYACVSQAHVASPGAHDFITGLQRDDQGRWYFASGKQGVCRVSPNGDSLEVLGTGLRNPNGLGISPDGEVVLSSVQEGNWTPASAICDLSRGGHFGAGGPKAGDRGYVPPMLYLPRGADNSCGGQAFIDSDRWGPAQGQWLHFSSGYAKYFLVLREVVGGESQAAAIPLPGEFLSGCHRGRFSPFDGQLYVASAQGWGNYGVADGALQRVRHTGGQYPYPDSCEMRQNGVLLRFANPQSGSIAETNRWFAQHWNYLYGPAYGSPEFSVSAPETEGHDRLEIRSVQRLDEGRTVFLEIPEIRPVHQLHLHFAGTPRLELFATVHRLGEPFTEFPGYKPVVKKSIAATQPALPGELSIAALMNACAACHHPTQQVVGPPFAEIRQRYAGNPDGIVKWAMNPENRNPDLPPMPSFQFLGEETLKRIATEILNGTGSPKN